MVSFYIGDMKPHLEFRMVDCSSNRQLLIWHLLNSASELSFVIEVIKPLLISVSFFSQQPHFVRVYPHMMSDIQSLHFLGILSSFG